MGIDLGLEKFLATSEGESIQGLKFFRKSIGQLKSRQRKLKHKKNGSYPC
jgi:putative transposase